MKPSDHDMSDTQPESKAAPTKIPESDPPIVSLRGVTKRFGDNVAVNDVTFAIPKGGIYGFIGPNGAGKTTTLKLIATLLKSDAGDIRVAGHSTATQPRAVRRSIGYMPDFLGVYHGLTTEEYLDFFGATYRIKVSKRRQLLDDLLALTDLTGKRSALVTSLSRGMQQRLGLARALIHDPKVLLLDEPASGLDPRARVEIRELLRELARMGKTILLSSHILADLEELCDQIGIIEQGTLLYTGEMRAALDRLQATARFEVRVGGSVTDAAAFLEQLDEVESVEIEDNAVWVALDSSADEGFLARRLVEGRFSLSYLARQNVRLEDAFLSITEGRVQ